MLQLLILKLNFISQFQIITLIIKSKSKYYAKICKGSNCVWITFSFIWKDYFMVSKQPYIGPFIPWCPKLSKRENTYDYYTCLACKKMQAPRNARPGKLMLKIIDNQPRIQTFVSYIHVYISSFIFYHSVALFLCLSVHTSFSYISAFYSLNSHG